MESTTGKTILIVDDDPDMLDQQQMALESAGFQVVRAGSQEEAEEWLADRRPDLAVVDLMMETTDAGFSLCHHIKKRYPATPVVVLTSVNSQTGLEFSVTTPEDRSWIKADAFLDKPVRFAQLQREVDRLLRT